MKPVHLYIILFSILLPYSNLEAQKNSLCGTVRSDYSPKVMPKTTNCYSTSTTDNTFDQFYIPEPDDEILTLRYNLHVMQFSADDPRNFEATNPDHQAFIAGMEGFLQSYFSNLSEITGIALTKRQ